MFSTNRFRREFVSATSQAGTRHRQCYNQENDRVTNEETFASLVDFVNNLDAEQHRPAVEGLSEEEFTPFDLPKKENMSKTDREHIKQTNQTLLNSLRNNHH